MASIIQHLLGLGFLGGFEDLENVSEIVAETSETSKDQQSESATGENNTGTCTARVAKSAASENSTCTCRICNFSA